MVKVRLIEKSVKSHVGTVIVVKVMSQYRLRGTIWKTKVTIQPIQPAMVEGVGGRKGGEEVADAGKAVVKLEDEVAAVRLRASDGANPFAMVGGGHL